MTTMLSPFVYWAQDELNVFLKIDLKDVADPKIDLKPNQVSFKAKGVGARGLNDYAFSLIFNSAIDIEQSTFKITDSQVVFTLIKVEKKWWPRLIKQIQKPVWLKVDYDRFHYEDSDKDEAMENDGSNKRDVRQDYPKLYEQLQKEEIGYRKESFKTVYLTFYNLLMYVGYTYVVFVLCIRYIRDGPDSFPETYSAVGPTVCFLQLIQMLEIMHPMFGYVRGGLVMPLLQVGGRMFVLFLMLEAEPRLQVMPVVFYLFMTWSAVEIIRYPYYMSQMLKKEMPVLTWLRYSAWMILYPIGFVCEAVIIFRHLIFLEQSQRWTYASSWPWEFTWRFSTVLRIYLLFIMIPAMYTLMSHMYKMRKQKIGPRDGDSKTKQKRLSRGGGYNSKNKNKVKAN